MKNDQVQLLLDKLATQLKADHLWQDNHPEHNALFSTAPFACDSMPLESWLQFLFLPKMQTLLDSDLTMPTNMGILPAAQLRFAQGSYANLLSIINEVDELFSQPKDQSCI